VCVSECLCVCIFYNLMHFEQSTLAQAVSFLTCILECSFRILSGSPTVLRHFVVLLTSSTISLNIVLINPLKPSGHYMLPPV
jgi:hypothetical protein